MYTINLNEPLVAGRGKENYNRRKDTVHIGIPTHIYFNIFGGYNSRINVCIKSISI